MMMQRIEFPGLEMIVVMGVMWAVLVIVAALLPAIRRGWERLDARRSTMHPGTVGDTGQADGHQ